ncbi:MAG: dihydroorotate dehydrogenase electron transfer subunit [Spirochaetales bacterium]|nr:dihydroorotate dehydrogenase electron transfer subunit [Spirochaetales bacterium]
MKQFTASIINNQEIAQGYYQLDFSWHDNEEPKPGQFFTVKINNNSDPLLRRPFAFSGYDTKSKTASMIFQKRGTTTQMMAGKTANETIDIIGPLGNFFPAIKDQEAPLLIAGGIGLGPILYLARTLERQKTPYTFLFGAPDKALVPDSKWFYEAQPIICTDNGSKGFKGNPLQYIESRLQLEPKHSFYACGPMGMLKSAAALAEKNNLASYSVMEQMMACGVGACMGCVIKHKDGLKRVCVDGPVFNSKDILWT